ncbi:hypothetical protein SELMODRAFT_430437 [Selaginella moellendorffii]|uniref:Uncharacterized protein n=1 Tax=Selaginella moellendorffii TaxID=88036 RepID=D8T9E7_SELML|nr:hypothetical protein SELMODRAFT_430437 [Selaginella moellendorffii]
MSLLRIKSASFTAKLRNCYSKWFVTMHHHVHGECRHSPSDGLAVHQLRCSNFNVMLGSGKTYSIRAASLFLFLEVFSLAHGRLMHVNGEDFSKYPALTLICLLALGYHDSNAAQYYVQNLRDDKGVHQVIKIMQKIVQGDNNRRLYLFWCCSLVWEVARVSEGGRSRTFINGAFNEVEITNYLAFVKADANTTKESIWWKTGWVPGLGAIEKSAFGRLASFLKLLSKGVVEDDEDDDIFAEQAAGELGLRDVPQSSFAPTQQTSSCSWHVQWTRSMSRFGSGHQLSKAIIAQACILVARYKQPVIKYDQEGSVTITPTAACNFRGSFTMAMTKEISVLTIFIPIHGTEKGLGCYYVADSHFVVIQFATGAWAIEDHEHIRSRARELFMSDDKSRSHVLAWVVYCMSPWFETRKFAVAGGGELIYHEAYLNFGCFDKILTCIDEKLGRVRDGRYRGEMTMEKHFNKKNDRHQ